MKYAIAMLLLLAVGCAEDSISENRPRVSRIKRLSRDCPVGSSKECLLGVAGVPDSVKKIDKYEVWAYPDNYGRTIQVFFDSKGKSVNMDRYESRESMNQDDQDERRYYEARRDAEQRQIRALQSMLEPPRPSEQYSPVIRTNTCQGLAPIVEYGCHTVCINGSWQTVCK